jgi:hypothetical protein
VRLDWDKDKRRKQSAAIVHETYEPDGGPERKTRTAKGQREEIESLCRELGREPSIPAMAYDARIEIQRLTQLRDSKRRLGLL